MWKMQHRREEEGKKIHSHFHAVNDEGDDDDAESLVIKMRKIDDDDVFVIGFGLSDSSSFQMMILDSKT